MFAPISLPHRQSPHRVLAKSPILGLPLRPPPVFNEPEEDVDKLATHLAVALRLGELIQTHFSDNPPELMSIQLGNDFTTTTAIEQFLNHVNDQFFPIALMGQEEWLANNPSGLDYIYMEPFGVDYEQFIQGDIEVGEPEQFLTALYVLTNKWFGPEDPLAFWQGLYPNRPFPLVPMNLINLLPYLEKLPLPDHLIHLPLMINYVCQYTGNPWLDNSYATFMDGYMEYPLWEVHGDELHTYWLEAKPLLDNISTFCKAVEEDKTSIDTIWQLLLQAYVLAEGQLPLPFYGET